MFNSTSSGGSACNDFSRDINDGASPQINRNLSRHEGQGRGATWPHDGHSKADLRADFWGPLGNYAKSSSHLGGSTPFKATSYKGSDTNKKQSTQRQSSIWDVDAKILENYAMQNVARQAMLEDFYAIPKEERSKKAHRVCNCRRDLRPVEIGRNANGKRQFAMSKPEIYKHTATGNTFYGGLMICGSSYACPLCAPKINEIDAAEIRHAVSEWVNQGGICLFITLTFPHHRTDTFAEIMQQFTKGALGRFRSGITFTKIKNELQYSGVIRSIEVTWGEANGFHPHSHEIWFVKPDFLYSGIVDIHGVKSSDMTDNLKSFLLEPIKIRLFDKWRSACLASGLPAPSYERGIDVKIAETEDEMQARLSEYLTKTGIEKSGWGVDDEMTRHNTKRGKPDRFTSFDFLRAQFDPSYTKQQKKRFLRLFAEYVKGFKGIAKIYWSPGLKAHFKIADLTEKQKAEQQTEHSTLLYTVPPPVWVFVHAINDHRPELLLKFKNEGVQAAKEFLLGLLDRYAEYLDERYDELPTVYQYILESIDEDT